MSGADRLRPLALLFVAALALPALPAGSAAGPLDLSLRAVEAEPAYYSVLDVNRTLISGATSLFDPEPLFTGDGSLLVAYDDEAGTNTKFRLFNGTTGLPSAGPFTNAWSFSDAGAPGPDVALLPDETLGFIDHGVGLYAEFRTLNGTALSTFVLIGSGSGRWRQPSQVSVVADGEGALDLVVLENYQDGTPWITYSRLSRAGATLVDHVPLTYAGDSPSSPQIALDPASGALVVAYHVSNSTFTGNLIQGITAGGAPGGAPSRSIPSAPR